MAAMSMIETLRDFVRKMESLGIGYLVNGSYTMAAHGEISMSATSTSLWTSAHRMPEPIRSIHRCVLHHRKFDATGYQSPRMFNIVNILHGAKIDCIVKKNTDFSRVEFFAAASRAGR